MKTKFQIAAVAAVLATTSMALYTASPASAQKMDADGDKAISWSEAKAKADTMWTKLDVNKDGKLDPADRSAKMGEKFASIDTDKNGTISRDEFMAHHRQMEAGKEARAESRGKGRGKHRGMGHYGMMGGGMGMLAMADTNKDGAVSRTEFDAVTKMHFDMADANKDGKITADERRAMMGKMGMKRGYRGPMLKGGMGVMGDGPPPPPPAN
ncbi:hypothetical protein IP81_00070 [Novosphingobium sp. AAP83]|uniref:EF-hand domain-containing protein n=1 Tax=Novosphingobium sp. AAP83 TaxID=1523425 RepID=UPI0006B8A8A0|nr:EF-hand domain-containing protein [Novosphingobium sp. AAP83]KPF93935.1 hypothetical protein IP81_00070 [Novosphingobium sp. AAP83]